MKMIKIYVGAMLLALVATACHTVNYFAVNYEQLKPAYYTLPSYADSVLVVDCSDFTTDEAAAQNFTSYVCSSLCNELNDGGYIFAALCRQKFDYETLCAKSDSICRAYSKKAIIALRRFDYSHYVEGRESAFSSYVLYTEVLAAQTTFSIVLRDGHERDFEQRNDTLTSSCYALSPAEAATQLPRLRDLAPNMAQNVSEAFARQLTPAWERVSRLFYKSNSTREFSQATQMLYLRQWDDARNLWLQIYSHETPARKALAAYNLAVAYERDGDVQRALVWCSKSLDHFDDPSAQKYSIEKRTAQNYFRILVQRANDITALDEQMGVVDNQ